MGDLRGANKFENKGYIKYLSVEELFENENE